MMISRLFIAAMIVAAGPATWAAGRAAPARKGTTGGPRRVAFLGLRPTADAAFGQTSIAQLPEAQRLRGVAENVVEILSGAPVLRHDDLRAAVGRTYLADLFDCRGDVTCQLRVAAPLARQGVVTAVVGDYFADGDKLRFRLRRLDLVAMRVAEEVTFASDRSAVETLAPWQEVLRPLIHDTGKLRIVANVSDMACTLDGRPCQPWPSEVLEVQEGEHVLELTKEGYRRASRVVAVKRGEESRVAVALEELPVQPQKAPDPSARLPTFAAPTEETQVNPFGSLRLAVLYDDVNLGEGEDLIVPPRGGPTSREGSVVFFPRPAVLGVGMQAPRSESGWTLRGGFGLAMARGDLPEFDSAFAELVKPESGFRVMFGWGAPIVSGLTAGTLTLPEGFGDLAPGLIGVTVSQSLGPVVIEGFVGKQKAMFSAEPEPGAAAPLPLGAARIAYVDEAMKGRLYNEDYPLTISISGIYGEERVGLAAEQEWALASGGFTQPPRLEDVPIWAGSLELFIPFGSVASFAGESYVGQSAHRFEGALLQVPRVDPATGRHRALRSAGGWAQLSVSAGESFDIRFIAGVDRILDGLGFGVAPGDGDGIRENRLAAVNGVWYLLGHLTLGIQLHAVQTVYDDPAQGRPSVLGAAMTSRLTF
ncbi:MAG TPA: PEGA domain-containing protein [Anaeromyxobacteraceae bacterium]|nr:PEGA domain-containing protein [Anaeromyxobacteraceae bacterium]